MSLARVFVAAAAAGLLVQISDACIGLGGGCCPPPPPPPAPACAPPPPPPCPPPPPPPCAPPAPACAPPPPPAPSCGGGGCGGGCARKKRQAVTPQLSTEQERPCPQAEWLPIIEKNFGADPASSAHSIQAALYKAYEHMFIVSCHYKKESTPVSLVAHGDGYCSASTEAISCQAVALAA